LRSFFLLNEVYMVLLHKKDVPIQVQDYRPISLIHYVSKLLSKALSRRLAPHMSTLVQPKQSDFIRGRAIHDNFMTVQGTTKLLHARRWPCYMLKVDIAKAFDMVSWPFLFEFLAFMGFSRHWINWVAVILSIESTRILLNSQPGQRICHTRGLRQSDPLSLLLFVLTMEALNGLFCFVDSTGML
jgi:hypothetical protein